MISYYTSIDGKPQILCTEEGDTLILENQYIFEVGGSLTFVDEVYSDGLTYFQKFFQITLDGINWSDWEELSNVNLGNITPKRNHPFSIRYKYVRVGDDISKKLIFSSVTLSFSVSSLPEVSQYNDLHYSKFFPFLNQQTIERSINQLEKVFRRGIIPKYLSRKENTNWEDEDYLNFWWTSIYLSSLQVTYNEVFKNLLFYPQLLKKYLQQRDIIVSQKAGLDELYYLLVYYYDEIMKRGTRCIFDIQKALPSSFINTTLKGEFFRLLQQTSQRESTLGIISAEETGWVVGINSPLYVFNNFYKDFIRGYEQDFSIVDLNLYPIFGAEYLSLSTLEVGSEIFTSIKINSVSLENSGGLDLDKDKAIQVDPNFNYEISFRVRGLTSFNSLTFGCKSIDSLGNIVSLEDVSISGTELNNFVTDFSLEAESDLFIQGLIFNKNIQAFTPTSNGITSHLKFTESVSKICPFISVSSETDVFIFDIKVRQLPTLSNCAYLINSPELVFTPDEGRLPSSIETIRDIVSNKLLTLPINWPLEDVIVKDLEIISIGLPYTLPYNL